MDIIAFWMKIYSEYEQLGEFIFQLERGSFYTRNLILLKLLEKIYESSSSLFLYVVHTTSLFSSNIKTSKCLMFMH